MKFLTLLALAVGIVTAAPSQQCYDFRNVKIGGGGGFVSGIIFNPTQPGLAYARTDIGGAYRLNPKDHTWIPMQDYGVTTANWGDWYIDSIASDPVNPARVYLFAGAYTNGWDPNNASVLASNDYGLTWKKTPLPFKGGGNQPGRGLGERLAVDPNRSSILFLGTRSGNGLWKSTNYGREWTKVESLPNVGTFVPDPNDASGYSADNMGVVFVEFDKSSTLSSSPTKRLFVGVADKTAPNIFISEDAGKTFKAIPKQPVGFIPHKAVWVAAQKSLYVTYTDGEGPFNGAAGSLQRFNLTDGSWTDISPAKGDFGFGGLSLSPDGKTIMTAALNMWWPDTQIYRSTDSGATWTSTWEWGAYPEIKKYYDFKVDRAPWLHDPTSGDEFYKLVGWMIESLEIDPHDPNHFLYGTGATIMGSRDLKRWDTERNFTLESLADGLEETAILGLASPKEGPPLLSAVGDITGFAHLDLNKSPQKSFTKPTWVTSQSIDYAGAKPATVVRVGNGGDTKQLAISTDSGVTWAEHAGAPAGRSGGKAVISADGKTIIWSGYPTLASVGDAAFESVGLPDEAIVAADKVAPSTFYAVGPSNSFLTSTSASFPSFSASTSQWQPTGTIKHIAVNPYLAGDVFVTTTEGLFRSKDFGKNFKQLGTIENGYKVAVGGSKTKGGEPIIFVTGVVGGVEGVYRSENGGVKWTRINGKRGFGSLEGNPLVADPRTYGRVYIGTNGRGIFYGDACW